MSEDNSHRIVIVGGGAGGLVLATQLGRKLGRKARARITLVDGSLTHLWKPLLHQVAAGSLNSYEDELNYFAHAKKNHYEFQVGRLENINRNEKTIQLGAINDEKGNTIIEPRALPYDTLVLAIGSTSNDFGTLGAREHCIFLDSRAQAERFHKEFLQNYLQSHVVDATKQPRHLNIAIVGAGATGVELAAELHDASKTLSHYGVGDIKPENVTITLIEAGKRILPALSEKVSHNAHQQLLKLGVNVMLGEQVTEVTRECLTTASGRRVESSLKVWSAGVKAPDFLKDIAGLESNRINQLVVQSNLQTTRDPAIFAIGDCAGMVLNAGTKAEFRLPPRAQVAVQQAQQLSKSLVQQMNGGALNDFNYRDYGSLVSMSRNAAYGNLMGKLTGNINVHGFIARNMYISLYRMHQRSLFGTLSMLVLIAKDLLNRTTRPRLKLH